MKHLEKPITIREKIAVTLVFYLLKIIAPYEYEHQFKEFYEDIKNQIQKES